MDILSDPAKGSRTLLEALTAKAYIYPSETYAHIPNGSTVEEGFRAVTYEQILHAVDATAFWLEDQLGKSTDFETLLYVGVSDLRYVLIFFAAQKCGYKVSTMPLQISRTSKTDLV
jgi:acyl-CoA synthetase (AMP-forming)/AMP-acid ligase II